MNLNKNTSYVLIHVLNGNNTAAEVKSKFQDIDIRSIQRALNRLTELGILTRKGTNNPSYSVNYNNLLVFSIADKLLENENRPKSMFNHELID